MSSFSILLKPVLDVGIEVRKLHVAGPLREKFVPRIA
jgi:hypothetical protein